MSLSIFRKLWLSRIQVLNCLKCQQFHASLLLLSFSLFCWLGQEQDKICWDITKSTEFHKIYWDLIKSTEITKSTKISWPDLTWHLEILTFHIRNLNFTFTWYCCCIDIVWFLLCVQVLHDLCCIYIVFVALAWFADEWCQIFRFSTKEEMESKWIL